MNDVELFFAYWAQAYAVVRRLWRRRRAAAAPPSTARRGSPDASASSPAIPAPPPDNDEPAPARWTPVRPALRGTAASQVPEHVAASLHGHGHAGTPSPRS